MAIWTPEELNGLKNNIVDGVTVAEMESIVESRKATAIIKKAQQLNYGVKTIDGVQCFYSGIKSRKRRTKAEIDESLSEKVTIVGEVRTATNSSAPTISESLENLTTDIVSNNLEKEKYTGLNAYTDAVSILQSNNLPVDHDFVCIFSKYILSTKDSA